MIFICLKYFIYFYSQIVAQYFLYISLSFLTSWRHLLFKISHGCTLRKWWMFSRSSHRGRFTIRKCNIHSWLFPEQMLISFIGTENSAILAFKFFLSLIIPVLAARHTWLLRHKRKSLLVMYLLISVCFSMVDVSWYIYGVVLSLRYCMLSIK